MFQLNLTHPFISLNFRKKKSNLTIFEKDFHKTFGSLPL